MFQSIASTVMMKRQKAHLPTLRCLLNEPVQAVGNQGLQPGIGLCGVTNLLLGLLTIQFSEDLPRLRDINKWASIRVVAQQLTGFFNTVSTNFTPPVNRLTRDTFDSMNLMTSCSLICCPGAFTQYALGHSSPFLVECQPNLILHQRNASSHIVTPITAASWIALWSRS